MKEENKEKKKYPPRKYEATRGVDGPKEKKKCHACKSTFFAESKYNILCEWCKRHTEWETYTVIT
jgi:hypothetical protein